MTRQGATAYLDADLRDTPAILEAARGTLDFTRPVAVMLIAVLHLIRDADEPTAIIARLMEAVPPGSILVLMAEVPLLNVNGPIPVCDAPAGVAISETCPAGVPADAVTCTVKLALAPCATVPLGEAVIAVVVAVSPTPPQALARLATFTVPSPVARSYPAVVFHAGFPPLLITPY